MYKCEILADSMNPQGDRITTFRLTYPRIIHAELMTHRMFSRNASSSRAVPVKKMIKYVKDNMFIPLAIQKAHTGMQGSDYFEGLELEQAKQLWIESAELSLQVAEKMEKFGITKQLINRILEPYQYYTVLVTATEWENFFELRCPKYQTPVSKTVEPQRSWEDLLDFHSNPINEKLITDNKDNWTFKMQNDLSTADIHIQAIAEMMWDCYNESIPKTLQSGEWHIPNLGHEWDIHKLKRLLRSDKYDDNDEITPDINEVKLKISTSHCARISYMTLGDNPKIDYEADIKLHDRLLSDKHLSCFEHNARAMSNEEYRTFIRGKCEVNPISEEVISPVLNEGWCNNFKGFLSYRYLIENK